MGTEYHWYILAHQNTAKQTANDYTTTLTGLKFKIAHKRAGSEKWSATPRTQRKRIIMFLRSVLADLEKQNDRAAAVIGASETPAARKHRKPGIRRAIVERAAGRKRRARRTSARSYSRRAIRVRRGQRRRVIS